MTRSVDHGRVLAQKSFEVSDSDTAFSLNMKCYEAGAASFTTMLGELLGGTLAPQPQVGQRSYFGRHQRPTAAGTLDFGKSAEDICALVRALDFGHYPNPLALPKVFLGDRLTVVRSAELQPASGSPPGTITDVGSDFVRVASASGDVLLTGLRDLNGGATTIDLPVGHVLPRLTAEVIGAIDQAIATAAAHEHAWAQRIKNVSSPELPYPRISTASAGGPPHVRRVDVRRPAASTELMAGFIGWLSQLAPQPRITLSLSDPAAAEASRPWFLPYVPLTVTVDGAATARSLHREVEGEVALCLERGPIAADLPLRLMAVEKRDGIPAVPTVGFVLTDGTTKPNALAGQDIALVSDTAGQTLSLLVSSDAYSSAIADVMASHLEAFLSLALDQPSSPLRDLPLAPAPERELIARANETLAAFAADRCIPDVIAEQIAATPDRTALVCHDDRITYEELGARAEALARRLVAAGARPGSLVGICMPRCPTLAVALLAIHRAGAAYLPLDPDYPRERLAFMLQDSQAAILVTDEHTHRKLALPCSSVVFVDAEASAPPSSDELSVRANPLDLAYVIYTSGSTGRPKGVMVTHRNVMNFFAGMDARIPRGEPAVWLAVTSLSFDISVLEIFWTLARGFTVVLHSDAPAARAGSAPQFSLFYFSSDEAADSGSKYRLLLEGAAYADRNDFAAVWTPERHFHAFGGLYPNAAMSSAAVAAITKRVAIRGGSCVLPLHHPIRVAEDWSMVDNLSHGRAGVAFASGWQPNDFVIASDRFHDRKETMLSSIDTVRRLWRGERLPFVNPMGKTVEIGTLPRPVQKELPIWLTAAGNPETFRQAGQLGAGVLTHLLGQTVEEVADKVRQYRVAWHEAGHPGTGHVTMMLHTFIGNTVDEVRAAVREPMKRYLGSAMDLVRQAAWTFPTFVQRAAADGRTPGEILDEKALSAEETDALLEHAFNRYFQTGGLFGTPESCLATVAKLKAIGVDEIACLIDFGVETDLVLRHLDHLKELMVRANQSEEPTYRASIPEEIIRHGVTHLQCTPSMASLLVADEIGRKALARLQTMMVGGEALPMQLAGQLRSILTGRLFNMYGPTETTIWSTTCDLEHIGSFVPLGRPIANTTLHVLDEAGRECPILVAGELHIGGDGVTRGYLHREQLTSERFIDHPLAAGGKLYKTGDLVRRHPDGDLEFLGRLDHQVKIRGHRIELGEIEAVLLRQPGVQRAVVVAREDVVGDKRLVGYITAQPAATIDVSSLRRSLAAALPDVMVPSALVALPSLPMTPNGKIDRNALPAPRAAAPTPPAAVENALERTIAAIWSDLLGLDSVGVTDNFFDLGGHSLLVVQVQRRLREALGREVAITDMFRFATIRALADHLGGEQSGSTAVDRGLDRARARQTMLQRRHGGTPRPAER